MAQTLEGIGSPLRTLRSQRSVSVTVKAKTEHLSSVKLISSLTLETLRFLQTSWGLQDPLLSNVR